MYIAFLELRLLCGAFVNKSFNDIISWHSNLVSHFNLFSKPKVTPPADQTRAKKNHQSILHKAFPPKKILNENMIATWSIFPRVWGVAGCNALLP